MDVTYLREPAGTDCGWGGAVWESGYLSLRGGGNTGNIMRLPTTSSCLPSGSRLVHTYSLPTTDDASVLGLALAGCWLLQCWGCLGLVRGAACGARCGVGGWVAEPGSESRHGLTGPLRSPGERPGLGPMDGWLFDMGGGHWGPWLALPCLALPGAQACRHTH